MARLTIPEPKIDIYNDGFEKHKTLLDRSAQGKQLSHIVETLDDPNTIAVDGAWGAGKSHFLKCWVGEHLKTHDNTEILYFDAFEHDYLDDPLVALTGALADRLVADDSNIPAKTAKKVGKTIRKIAPFVGKTALRMGVSYITAGIVNRADDWFGGTEDENSDAENTAKAVSGSAAKDAENVIGDFWKTEASKQAAVADFRDALADLTKPDKDDGPKRRLVIVVDELDRCRPDYALNVLEIIKHFFNVDGVHFVLGINQRAMQNHVIARYGAGIDAALYLQKFVQVTMRLGDLVGYRGRGTAYGSYFDHLCSEMRLFEGYSLYVKDYISHLSGSDEITLRGLQQIARMCAITPWPRGWQEKEHEINLISGLLFLEIMHPKVITKIRDKTFAWEDVSKSLSPSDLEGRPGEYDEISLSWLLCFQEEKSRQFWEERLGDKCDMTLASYGPDTPRHLLEQYIGSISIEDL